MTRRARRACLALALALSAVAGCRTPAPPPRPAAKLDAERLLAGVVERSAARHALRGFARVSLDGPNGSGRAKQVVVAERPARLRVEFLGFLNQTVALFATDGERFDWFRAEDRLYQEGRVRPGLLFDAVQVDLSPEEAVSVLLGDPGPLAGLHLAGAGPRSGAPGLRVDLADESGALRRRLEFDGAARLRHAEAREPGGGVAWEVAFDDYRELDGVAFAHEIDLHVPWSETRARLAFREVELNPELPDGAFELEPPAGAASLRHGGRLRSGEG